MPHGMDLEHTRKYVKAEKNNNDAENTRNSNQGLPRRVPMAEQLTYYPVHEDKAERRLETVSDSSNRTDRSIATSRPVELSSLMITTDKKALQKQLQKLTRKLDEIKQLESSTKALNPEQQAKLASKSQVEAEIIQVRQQLG